MVDPTSPSTPDDLVGVASDLRTRMQDAAVPPLQTDAEQVIRQGRGIRTRRTVLATVLGMGAVGIGAGVMNQVGKGDGPVKAGDPAPSDPTTKATPKPTPTKPLAAVKNPDHLGAVRPAKAQPKGAGHPEDGPGLVYDVYLEDQNGLSATYVVTGAGVTFQFAKDSTQVGKPITVAIPKTGVVTAVKAPVANTSCAVLVVGGPEALGPIFPHDKVTGGGGSMIQDAQGTFIGSVSSLAHDTGDALPTNLTAYLRQRYDKHQLYAFSASGVQRKLFTTTVDLGVADPALLAQDEDNDLMVIYPGESTIELFGSEGIAIPRTSLVGESHFAIRDPKTESGKGLLYGAFIPADGVIDKNQSGVNLAAKYSYAIKGKPTQLQLFSAPRDTTGLSWTDPAGKSHTTTLV